MTSLIVPCLECDSEATRPVNHNLWKCRACGEYFEPLDPTVVQKVSRPPRGRKRDDDEYG